MVLLLLLLILAACGGDDAEEEDASPATATLDPDAPLSPEPTVDTSVDLPPEITVDPDRAIDDVAASPRPRTSTPATDRESTLPPAVADPTETIVPPTARPTETSTPAQSPTPTEPVPVGSCDGFGYDESVRGEISNIAREASFELAWTPPLDIQRPSYVVRVLNSASGQIFQSTTTGTSFTVPERVTTNRAADGQLFWEVEVLSNGVSLGCTLLTGEARFTTSP